jgi:poly(ADP-ribose) glycohydrolase
MNLKLASQRVPSFFSALLPFLWDEGQPAPETLRPRPLLAAPGVVTLSQRECLCVLANAFFCSFTNRKSDNCVSGPDLPSINFDELYGGYGSQSVARGKLHMLFEYFERMAQRRAKGDRLDRRISFERYQAQHSTVRDWLECEAPLARPSLQAAGLSIDEAKDALRVDFANRILGGAAVAYGCVQEEIMFCLSPELIVGRLYCPAMRDDEAIVIRGAEQFSKPEGYGFDLLFGGGYEDRSPLGRDNMLTTSILAVDASDFRSRPASDQYTPALVLRELGKLWAAFPNATVPQAVATGNWGCGVFEGDVELKFLIQWMALSRAEKTMHYFPWSEKIIVQYAPAVVEALCATGTTVGECAKFLLEDLKPGKVFEQALQRGGRISYNKFS